jgi:hypothetical protein
MSMQTNFSGLANDANASRVYSHAQSPEEATQSGDYEKNTQGIKKPTIFLTSYHRQTPKSPWSRT